MMKRTLLLMLVWAGFLQAHAGSTIDAKSWFTPPGNGRFSAVTQNVCKVQGTGPHADIWSPNHLRKITTRPSPEGDTAMFAVDENRREFAINSDGWPCPEVGWSPTSNLFFVTYSDGGAVGTYHVSAYRFSEGSLIKIDPTPAVRRDFQKRYPKCFSPEEPNIAGIAWSADSTKLLVAAEVLPHANCDDMGTFALYAVTIPDGKVIDRIPQVAAKASLHDALGPELRGADDRCLLQPGSCQIPALHQQKKGKSF
jgi:hypothetical protein